MVRIPSTPARPVVTSRDSVPKLGDDSFFQEVVLPESHGCLACRPVWAELFRADGTFTVSSPFPELGYRLGPPLLHGVEHRWVWACRPGRWLLKNHTPDPTSRQLHPCPNPHPAHLGGAGLGLLLMQMLQLDGPGGPYCLSLLEGPVELPLKIDSITYLLVPVDS